MDVICSMDGVVSALVIWSEPSATRTARRSSQRTPRALRVHSAPPRSSLCARARCRFDLILDEEIVVSTSPFGEPSRTLGLGQGICYLQPAECRVRRGATVPLVAATNGSELAFTINEDKLTGRGEVHVAGSTRFDPRWEGARANLDDAWKKILTNLSYNPKEFKLMQDAVMRFAAQPVPFNITPVVGERCALTFLAE